MLLADATIHFTNNVNTGSIATVVAAGIVGWFSLKAAKISKKTNDKVGNGWTEALGKTLDKIQDSADISAEKSDKAAREAEEAKRKASSTDEQIRKTRGTVDRLSGQFDQHITQHNWRDK